MSTLKTHNLQSPDASSVNIALTQNAGMVVAGVSTLGIGAAGGVDLLYQNVSRLSTQSYGIAINGNILLQEELVHIGDTDTKIKFPSAGNTVSFETAGSERLRITSDGKMGLGTNNPNADFHIKSSFPAIRFEDDSDYSQIDANGGSLRLLADAGNASSNSNIQFSVDGTERMRISSDGSVGIGTNNNEASGPGIEIYSPNLDTQVRLRALDGVNKVHFDSRETNGGTYIYFTDSSATYNSFIHRSHSSNASMAGLRYCYNGSANEAIRISESGGFDMGGAGYGTAGQVLKSNGDAPPTWSGGSQRVLEVVASPCDGSTIATSNGNVTFQNVTAQQNLSTTYADVNGSVITYQPPAGTTQVIYEMSMQVTNHDDAVSIGHFRFYVDGTEVAYHRRNASSEDIDNFVNFKYIINIGGSANTNTGRIASWSNAKQMKMTAREYHATNNAISIHTTDHWNGSGSNQFSQPLLQITAIGV